MKTQGRKNVHGKGGVRFKAAYTASKHKAMLRNVVSELIVHERVVVTAGIAKDVRSLADRMITYGKIAVQNSGKEPEQVAKALHARRLAAAVVRNIVAEPKEGTTALDKLFAVLAVGFKDRNGGYTRILKMNPRRGDNAPMAIVEFVK